MPAEMAGDGRPTVARIGVTERGDAGLDFSWVEKAPRKDVTILVTKNANDRFLESVMELTRDGVNLIVHADCTGWGGSAMEPHVPEPAWQLDQTAKLLAEGFPKERLVLRVDPLIPTAEGLARAEWVLERALRLGLLAEPARVRVSVLDEYVHVKSRLRAQGLTPIYGASKYAPPKMMAAAAEKLDQWHRRYGVTFETCAEPELQRLAPDAVAAIGCCSQKDLQAVGITAAPAPVNPQGRYGCLCLSGKTELLKSKGRCPHGCLYCYWTD